MYRILSLLLTLALFGFLAEARSVPDVQLEKTRKSLLESRVIGGSDVPMGAIPFQVSIQNTFGEHVCGGAIIAPEWILTAAHCLNWPKQYLKVVTGSVNWTVPDAVYFVDEVKVHCLHDKPMYHNDIALIHLSEPIVYNERTQPVALARSNSLKAGDKLILSGWGATKVWGRHNAILQQSQLYYMEHDKCAASVRNSAWLGAGHICTDTAAGKGSCNGDSGGPLYDPTNKMLVGIVNWGEPCAVGYPDAFASVAYYHDWILNIMQNKSAC